MSKRQVIIFIVGLLLFVPSLWAGFILDDFYYLGAIEGRFPDHNTERSLFTFFINDEAATRQIAWNGGYPWWIDEQVSGETFRPLSESLFRLDHVLFGQAAIGYHLHSLVWWGLVLWACGLFYRRVLPGAIGTLALLLFVIDDSHVMPVAWISNRNALVAVAPMLFGLWGWMRWWEERWRPGIILALGGIVIGLAGSELGVAMLGYFAAYALLGAPARGIGERLMRLAPVAALGLAYAVVYRALGFSSSSSGAYHHPLQDPVGYLTAAPTGIPTLLSGGIAGFSADFWYVNPALRPALVVVGCVAALGLLLVVRACRNQLDNTTRRTLRWLLVGSALALLPIAAVFPADRMWLVPGVGLTAAIATILVVAYRSWKARRRWWLISTGAFLAFVHLVWAAFFTAGMQYFVIRSGRQAQAVATSPVVAGAAGKDAILVFSPDVVVSIYTPVIIGHLGVPGANSWRPLSIAPYDHTLRRTGPRTLELEVAEGGVMLRSLFEELYRSHENLPPPGTIIDRGLLRAEIMDANERGPTRIAFHFDRDLTDPSLCFLVWQESELRPAQIPDIGEEILLKRSLGPGGF